MEVEESPQRIIVVDDDPFVRDAIEMILTGAGHTVRATASGAEALRWLDQAPHHLLIVDLSMPEIDGPTLYKQLRARSRGVLPRVLFMSGYGDLGAYHDDPEIRGVPALRKPFNLGDLLSAVRQALVTV